MSQTIIISVHDPNIAYLLQRYAEESGHPTTYVCPSTQVLGLALALEPALVILDMELIEATNFQVVRQLKAEPATANVPVIIYSYLDEPPAGWQEGVDGYLLNSVMYDDFVAVVERASSTPSTVKTDSDQVTADVSNADTTEEPIQHRPEPATKPKPGRLEEEFFD
jgi:CheY-like chemotaxis protein